MFPRECEGFLETRHARLVAVLGSYDLRPSWQINSLAAHPDGRSFFASAGQHLFRWDAHTGRELSRWDAPIAYALAPEGDGASVLLLSIDGLHRVSAKGAERLFSPPRPEQCHHATFSRDLGAALISGSFGLRLWRGKPRATSLEGNGYRRTCLSPGGARYLFAAEGHEGRLEARRGKALEWSLELGAWIRGLAFLSEEAALVALLDGRLLCVDAARGAVVWSLRLKGELHTPVVAGDGSLAAVSSGEAVYVVDPSGELRCTLPAKTADEDALVLAGDGSWIVCVEDRTTPRIFALPSGKERLLGAGHRAEIVGLGWLGDSRRLLSGAKNDPQVRLWDTGSAEAEWIVEIPAGFSALRLLPDGRRFVAGYSEGVSLFELRSGARLGRVRGENVGALEASPDAAAIYWCGYPDREGRAIHAWRFEEPQPRWQAQGTINEAPHSLSLSRDGSLWVFRPDAALQLDAESGREISRLTMPYGYQLDGSTLLGDGVTVVGFVSWLDRRAYSSETFLRRFDGVTGRVAWSVPEGGVLSSGLLVSRGERWAVRRAYDRVVFHDLEGGARLDEIQLSGAVDTASSLALSPDERRLAVGTGRGLVLIFELRGLPA